MKSTKTLGHCQCCGREQAVLASGNMSKHGYEVINSGHGGWFNGVCTGDHFNPMEIDRTQTDLIVRQVLREVADLNKNADDYESGKKIVSAVSIGRRMLNGKRVEMFIPFLVASSYYQDRETETVVYNLRSKAKQGKQWSEQMTVIVNKYHGADLKTVVKAEPAAQIQKGEKRVSKSGKIMIAKYQDGARVYFSMEQGGFAGWLGSRAWRSLASV